MALSLADLIGGGVGQASSGDYRHGLGKKSCCTSCEHGGPCTGCGGPAGSPCRCAGGLGSTTIMAGQADLEPGDWGYQYTQTTKPGTTVAGRAQGRPPVARRIAITRAVAELEFLAGTPGVHPRVLAQKVWLARKALMGTAPWSWANYQNQASAYDSYDDLVSRLQSVERVLGVGNVSPKIMSQYGMGGLGVYTGAVWGQQQSPVAKLAQCIQGALCMPKAFCCDQGTYFNDPYYDEQYPEDFPSPDGGAPAGNGNGSKIGDPRDPRTWRGVDPKTQMTLLSSLMEQKRTGTSIGTAGRRVTTGSWHGSRRSTSTPGHVAVGRVVTAMFPGHATVDPAGQATAIRGPTRRIVGSTPSKTPDPRFLRLHGDTGLIPATPVPTSPTSSRFAHTVGLQHLPQSTSGSIIAAAASKTPDPRTVTIPQYVGATGVRRGTGITRGAVGQGSGAMMVGGGGASRMTMAQPAGALQGLGDVRLNTRRRGPRPALARLVAQLRLARLQARRAR
jgi:hypothetical protein